MSEDESSLQEHFMTQANYICREQNVPNMFGSVRGQENQTKMD